MDSAQAYKIIRGRLGQRAASDKLADIVLTELYAAQIQLEDGPTLPSFLIRHLRTGVLANGRVNLPTSFLSLVDSSNLWWYKTTSNVTPEFLAYPYNPKAEGVTEYAQLERRFQAEAERYSGPNTSPQWFDSSRIGSIQVFPWNNSQTSAVSFSGYFRDEELTTLSERQTNLWLTHAPMCLIARAGSIIAALHLRDDALAAIFSQEFNAAYDQLFKKNVLTEIAGLDLNQPPINPEDLSNGS